MKSLEHLFENNRKWAEKISQSDPSLLPELAKGQFPDILLIGCSDSRVPPNEILGLRPGKLFVHRNIANLLIHTDINCLSVLQYAIDVLKVKHIIICGHYGCGGINAALDKKPHGLIDNWLRHIHDIYKKYEKELGLIKDEGRRVDYLCELNVVEQVLNAASTPVVREARQRGQPLTIHGWIYQISDGLVKDLKISISCDDDLREILNQAGSSKNRV